ncbi:MAG: hypothetical protein EOP85_14380, partial [Verrucomicrobiaceae bacterium]
MAFSLVGAVQAQLATSLRLNKSQFLAGEPVIAVVTITNHAGRELVFYGDSRTQWLNFVLKNHRNEAVLPRGNANFGKMKILAGQSLAREVNLSQIFLLDGPGSYSVSAVVRAPGSLAEGSSTNRVAFTQTNGTPYWSQKVGIPRTGSTREFRLLPFNGETKTQLYAQIIDGRTGQNVRTFLLGDVMMLRKPLATVDKDQRMHVMFLATPTMWVHCQIDTDGKVVDRKIHERAAQGDPQLLTFGDGSVRVSNSIP